VRAVGLDLGRKRIGVAVSDSAGLMAVPSQVVERTGDDPRDRRRIAAIVDEVGAERVVVGLPLSMDGSDGPAATWARAEAEALAAVVGVPVELHDERLSTVTAQSALVTAGVKGRDRRRVVDQTAATVILQSWLDGRRRRAAG
jgi:putative Holliday junction resolvase